MKKAPVLFLLTGSIASLVLSLLFVYFNMIGLELAFYKAFFTDMIPLSVVPQVLIASLLVSFLLCAKSNHAPTIAKAILPGCFAALIFLFPLAFPSILFVIFIWMICIWRLALVGSWHFPAVKSAWLMPLLVCLGALGGCIWGIYMQVESFHRLWFTLTDWTEYYTGYVGIRNDPWNFLRYLYNAGHFNPLPNVLIPPVLALFPGPQTLFVLNSLFIYLTVPLWYLVARSLGMLRFSAGLLACLLMFHFTLPNLNLSLFYGFHPIVMFPALLLLFYLNYRKGNRKGMFFFFALSLLLQETVAVFWCGWAFYLILQRKYWQGVLLGAFSCAWFAFAVKIISPVVKKMLYGTPDSWNANYVQTFHYANIGNSISDILLSPITKPSMFFGQFLSPLNLWFLLVLLLAFFPLGFADLCLLATALPLLAGLFLMGGSDALNISMWYQTEIFAILTVAAASGFVRLRQSHSFHPIGIGLERRYRRPRRIALAAVFTVAAGCFFCGLFFGRLPFGKYAFSRILERPDCMELISKVREQLPPNAFLLTTPQMQIHFLDHPTGNIMQAKMPFTAPYLLLYLDDLHVDFDKNQDLFESMQKNSAYELIFEHKEKGCHVEFYRRRSESKTIPEPIHHSLRNS